jgi:hypothetical protein
VFTKQCFLTGIPFSDFDVFFFQVIMVTGRSEAAQHTKDILRNPVFASSTAIYSRLICEPDSAPEAQKITTLQPQQNLDCKDARTGIILKPMDVGSMLDIPTCGIPARNAAGKITTRAAENQDL